MALYGYAQGFIVGALSLAGFALGAFVGTRGLWTHHLLPVAVRPAAALDLPVAPGDTGPTVAQLQRALNRHGAHVTVDGGYGAQTKAAVLAWKQAHDFKPTPVVRRPAYVALSTR